MTSRFRLVLVVGSLTLAGCGDVFNAGPIVYKDSDRLATELKDKPNLQAGVRKTLADLYGPAPQEIVVPAGSGLPEGGRRLANYEKEQDALRPIQYVSVKTGDTVPVLGGYGLYRKYCLHCHGVEGGGDGPTSGFLYPRPRDYRLGVFKFTSTAPSNPKPTRDDLRKTIRHGLHGTSMPAFEALMADAEIEQVIDYVIFLSMRGETEKNLIDEAKITDGDPAALEADTVKDLVANVLNNWKAVEGLVVSPKARRTAPTHESVLRGRDIFLGINTTGNKVACTDCHGNQGLGNGTSFVEKRLFDKIVFSTMGVVKTFGDRADDEHRKAATAVVEKAVKERYHELQDEEKSAHMRPGEGHASEAPEDSAEVERKYKEYHDRTMTAWKPGSIDDWGNPLRPANLNLGVYKGGRRPIDLYWRIAKGINGAKMPAHASLLPDEQIWDVVNFVLALPYEPELLKDADALKKNAAVKPAALTSR